MKYFILGLALILNTGCASWCLVNAENRYNDVLKEVSVPGQIEGLVSTHFKYKGKIGTLISMENCLKGENRLLHIFLDDEEENQTALIFEDDDLIPNYSDTIKGEMKFGPYDLLDQENQAEEIFIPNDLNQRDILISISQLYICHGGSHTHFNIYYDGKKYTGFPSLEYEERSKLIAALYKPAYLLTVPIDAVIIILAAPIAGVAAVFN